MHKLNGSVVTLVVTLYWTGVVAVCVVHSSSASIAVLIGDWDELGKAVMAVSTLNKLVLRKRATSTIATQASQVIAKHLQQISRPSFTFVQRGRHEDVWMRRQKALEAIEQARTTISSIPSVALAPRVRCLSNDEGSNDSSLDLISQRKHRYSQ